MNEVSLAEMSSGGPPHPGAAWRQLADRESGFPYYWNTATNQVSNHPLQAFIHHEPETKKVRNYGLGPDLVQIIWTKVPKMVRNRSGIGH